MLFLHNINQSKIKTIIFLLQNENKVHALDSTLTTKNAKSENDQHQISSSDDVTSQIETLTENEASPPQVHATSQKGVEEEPHDVSSTVYSLAEKHEEAKVDRISRIVFPLSFGIFTLSYFLVYQIIPANS